MSLLGLVLVLGVLGCGREDVELAALESDPEPEPTEPEPDPTEPEPTAADEPEPTAADEPEPTAAGEPEPAATAEPEPDVPEPDVPEPEPATGEPEPEPAAAEPEPSEDCSAQVPAGLVAARPPMGWNGYNAFGGGPELDEAKLQEIVQALVDSGMQSAGYRYVNLDYGWQELRSADGERVFIADRLPSGVQALAESIHARGLLFGVYSYTQDCEGTAGGQGYEAMDAAAYAAWGVDYLKYVRCGNTTASQMVDLADALAQTDRSIVLSLAAAPFQEWMRDTAHVWRTGGDIRATWSSIVSQLDTVVPLAAYARPGAFNDPDMLEVGNGTLTLGEQRVHFSTWAILSAPLLAGNDLTTMNEETLAILTNSEVIALNQDPLGLQAALVARVGGIDVLAKPLAACGARGVVLWNRGDTDAEISLLWEDVWLEPGIATVRDLWAGTTLDATSLGFSVTVPSHDAVALRIEGTERPLPRGQVPLTDLRWTYATNGYGPVELDTTNGEDEPLDGAPIRLRGAAYDRGLGVHGPSLVRYRLGRACSRFIADIGVDDDVDGRGSVQFEVWADGERLFQSGVVTGTSPALTVDIDVTGRRELRLFVSIGGDDDGLDHAVWAGATLECDP